MSSRSPMASGLSAQRTASGASNSAGQALGKARSTSTRLGSGGSEGTMVFWTLVCGKKRPTAAVAGGKAEEGAQEQCHATGEQMMD